MRVLLHTPLKPPDSKVASGDREMGRGLGRLLRRLGHSVIMPPLSRVAPGVPMFERHLALQRRARAQAARLIARWRALPARHPERFDLWFTYHCYYRKPDWLGPIVSCALDIPYGISEASQALLADAASHTVRARFSYEAGVDWIAAELGQPAAAARAAE